MIQTTSKNNIDKMISLVNINIICGFKESGKKTIASILEKKYNYKHYNISNFLCNKLHENKISFTHIKNKFEDEENVLNINTKMQYQNLFNPNNRYISMVNKILQQIENEYILSANEDVQNIVISDLKCMNEYNAFIELLYRYPKKVTLNVIKMIRNNKPRYFNIDKHGSDIEHLNFSYNYIIENNSNIDTLTKKIQNLHSQIQNDITTNSCRRINMLINR